MTTPNQDSADDGSMTGVLKAYLKSFVRENLDDMLPARVISYNDQTNRAIIQPLIMMGTTDGQKISRAQVTDVPVFRFGGGGFFIHVPLVAGNFGWLKANDRDLSLLFQGGGQEDWPNTERLHSFSDSMFFPDTLKGWSSAEPQALTLQTLDGTNAVVISQASIEFRVGAQVLNLSALGLFHNGINIGNTHFHIGSPSAPDGPVSPTGTPL